MIWCVADRRRRSYIRALHTRFYREPELWSTRAALEHTCRKIKGRLGSKTRKFCYSWRIGRTNCGWRPPWYLYRRVSAGHGDCWGTGALFFRRRGRKASHRVGENRASPRQRLIWYTKRKSCRKAALFVVEGRSPPLREAPGVHVGAGLRPCPVWG